MQLRIFLLAIFSLFFIKSLHAQNHNVLPYDNQKISFIAKSITWKKLIKLEGDSFTKNSNFAIHSQNFYFSDLVTLTPKSELIKTLTAFLSKKTFSNINENPQCRFPARYVWLKSKFDLSDVKPVICQNFLDWSMLASTKSLSLIFATGYLGNPASYYGHTLLKLNSTKNTKLNLLETSVNFGADVPVNEDPISYIIKGVIGGYDASFTHSKFYFHTQNYLENELRDMWEYKLNLSQDDYYFLVAHIWELIEQNYTYYFFDENCVFRMYELFTLLDDIKLPSINTPWVIPQEVIRAINLATYKNYPLVKKVKYIPSRQAKFYNKFWQLDSREKIIVEKISINDGQLQLLRNKNLSENSKFKILSVLLDYYQYLMAVDKENLIEYKKSYTKALTYRYQLPAGKAKFTKKKLKAPHSARPSSYIQITAVHNRELGNGMIFKLRPAYYDQLDAESGHVKNGALKMGELDLEYISSQLAIRNLSLFDITSVKNEASGLLHDGYDSWKLYLGIQKQDDKCISCSDFTFKASKGLAIPINKTNTTIGAYIGGALVENYNNRGRVYILSNLTLSQSVNNNWNFLIDLEARKYLENEKVSKFNFRTETRYKFKLNNDYLDLRFSISKNETLLSLGYYW